MKSGSKSDELFNSVSQSSTANRTYFVSFTTLLIYVLIIVASTTDYQLLIPNSQIRLPFVDANVTLLTFYIIVPIMILAGHFNMLQNLESHHHKLIRWRNTYPNQNVPRSFILPFLYDFFVLEQDGKFFKFIRIFSSLLFLYLAPSALLAFLITFSNYQSFLITIFHFTIFCLDFYFIGIFLKSTENRFNVIGILLFFLGLFQTALLTYIAFADTTNIWKNADTRNTWENGQYSDCCYVLLPDGSENPIKPRPLWRHLLPRIIVNSKEYATMTGLTTSFALDSEKEPTRSELIKWSQTGLDFSNRTLKGAQLIGLNLNGADFSGANLEGADFNVSDLQASNFSLSCVRGAVMESANMYGADFSNADLSYVSFLSTNLGGTGFKDAILIDTYFTGQDLGWAKPKGSYTEKKYKSKPSPTTACSPFMQLSQIYIFTPEWD